MRINEELRIRWSHNKNTRETACQILNNDDRVVVAGIARAFVKDPFCKAKGRNASLTKALKVTNSHGVKMLDKDTRTKVWSVCKENGVKLY